MTNSLEDLFRIYAEYNALESAISLMNWDRQVLMPSGGAPARTAHIAILTQRSHQIITSDELALALEYVEKDAEPGSELAAQAAALRREVNIETKLPAELVNRKSRASSDAYETWKIAKATSDFALLSPFLKDLFDIAGETAELLGYVEHKYDALIDLYEPGATCADAVSMFDAIKTPIINLVQRIQKDGFPVDSSLLEGDWNSARLRAFAQQTQKTIGFDFTKGRLNIAPNAFCMNLSCGDVRMTTRASKHIKGIVSSSLHELGHGLYEQNSPPKWDRTPLAGGVSLAVHESQSRLWENIVGRSKGFWTRFLPDLQAAFPVLGSMSVHEFYRAINEVGPEFTRVGADELTYNLHILVRFELEVEILTGKIQVSELPDAWNAKYEDYLGITPPNDSLGCLQDVHWSRGSVGYFPTYAMGNLIGAQMWECLERDLGDTEALMVDGDFKPILGWLVDKVYSQSKRLTPRALVTQVTGRPMDAASWLAYAERKYSEVYSLH